MKRLTVAISVLLAVTGCQNTPEVTEQVNTNQLITKESTTITAYQQSLLDYKTWQTTLADHQPLKIYSYDLYEDLSSSWNKAIKIQKKIASKDITENGSYSLFSSTTNAQEFTKQLSIVAAKHAAILTLKAQADVVLADAMTEMNYLNQIDAKAFLAREYHYLYDDYSELFEYIEENKINDAKVEQIEFLKAVKIFEMEVMLIKYVDPLKKEIEDFKAKTFNSLAPVSFAKAAEKINSASHIVKADPRNLKVIEQAVAAAKFELAHVRNVSNEVNAISEQKKELLEQVVLTFEEQLLSISSALNGADYRDQPLQIQSEMIVNNINETNKKIETATATVPQATTATVPQAATATQATTTPQATTTTVPQAATATVPQAATATVPQAATATVPQAATATVPQAATATLPQASTTTVPQAATTTPVTQP